MTTTHSPTLPTTPATGLPRARRGLLDGLVLATLAVGTSGHAVTGLLPVLVAYLHTPVAVAGQLATAFALTCGLAAPALAVVTGRWDRRVLLTVCLLLTALGNAVAAAAPTYLVLVAGRVVTALGAATATAAAVGIAATTSPPTRRARAMATVLAGLTLALAIGVPGVAALAYWTGHRPALWAVTALCVLAAGVVASTAPRLPAPPVPTVRDRLAVAARPGVAGVLVAGLLMWGSTGVVYPYLAVVIEHETLPTSAYLAAYGIGAAAGTLVAGRLVDLVGPRFPLVVAALGAAVLLLLIIPTAGSPAALITVAMWGELAWSTTAGLNAWCERLGGEGLAPLLLALVAAAIYLGMGLGGIAGGVVVAWAGPGRLPLVAAVLAVLAAYLFLTTGRASGTLVDPPSQRAPAPFQPTPSWPLR